MHRPDLKTGKGLMQDADSGPSLFPAGTNQAVDRKWIIILPNSVLFDIKKQPHSLISMSSTYINFIIICVRVRKGIQELNEATPDGVSPYPQRVRAHI
jgi:hypothetical protein